MGAAQYIQQLFHRQFPLQKSLYRKGKIHILTKSILNPVPLKQSPTATTQRQTKSSQPLASRRRQMACRALWAYR